MLYTMYIHSHTTRPSCSDLTAWLTLHLAPGFTFKQWQDCWQHFSTPAEFCLQTAEALRSRGLSPTTIAAIQQPDKNYIDHVITWMQDPTHHLLTYHDPRYPSLLKHIPQPPPLLYVWGQAELLEQKQLAIVGTRNPTLNAKRLAHYFAGQLSQAGLLITSGLAIGIDTAAHEGALAGNHPTIAVLGSGIHSSHLAKKKSICEKISAQGALISEFPMLLPPRPQHFPQRNRIISGLSLGTLVVEAALKSGSLITARCALEQGREVFAIPGHIMNPMVAGCHYLIQQGAKLTTCIDDILLEIAQSFTKKSCNTSLIGATLDVAGAQLNPEQRKVLECIAFEPTPFEYLVDTTGFSCQRVTALLCSLKLHGYIKEELNGLTRVIV